MTNTTITPLKDKVVFLGTKGRPTNSLEFKLALSVLEVGKTYTIKSANISDSFTDFELVELPGAAFNSVMFGPPHKEQKEAI